ncbi:MAG: tRNA pseudouridine(38-40) synthase TruA [Alphaproteobacteria bacterium GM202ARS2]|nr:tRNA pseudouridine(38-40) synthase TruA [Alphaproteobacteria bacterium GM202ARS2]
MQRWKLTLEYDGSAFNGWQRQNHRARVPPHVFSAQHALEDAIFAFCQQRVTSIVAGRTDSGVHALAQVAHVDLAPQPRIDANTLQHGLTFHLKQNNHDALVLIDAQAVAPSFHARFSAHARHYLYRILNRPTPSPLLKKRVWHVPQPLDIQAMRKAAHQLVGLHDFNNFRAAGCQAKNTHRHLTALDISRTNDLIQVHAQAPAFLYKQVRIMTAALVAVGRGRLSLEQLADQLSSTRPTRKQAAPPHGLYLQKVDYTALEASPD